MQFLMFLLGWLQWQWADTGIANKCCLCPFEACWFFEVHTKSFSCKSGYFALRTCRLVIWPITFTWCGMNIKYVIVTSNNHYNLSCRTLPTNACQGFSPFLWSEATTVRCNRLFTEGEYLMLWFSLTFSLVLIIVMVVFEQIQSKYGTANKESVRFP